MSSHFSANQYESAFSPQRLQNYEVPAQHKQNPSQRRGCTKVISDSRGHITAAGLRSPASPWGSFVGTWQSERRPLQVQTRTKLMAHLAQSRAVSAAPLRPVTGTPAASREGSRAESARGEREKQHATAQDSNGSVVSSPLPRSPAPEHPASEELASRPPSDGSRVGHEGSRPDTSLRSVQGSVTPPLPSPAPRQDSPRVLSPSGSLRPESAAEAEARPLSVQSIASSVALPPGSAGSHRTRSSLASRPESRMGPSGTQSPLGSRPVSSRLTASRGGSAESESFRRPLEVAQEQAPV